MLAMDNDTIYYDNIRMTLPHLASGRRSWGRHRRNWRWSRGHVHRVVMGGVPKTTGRCGCHQKVLIAHIDSSGLLQGTWTALVSTCAIYTAHFTWGLLWLLCGKTNAIWLSRVVTSFYCKGFFTMVTDQTWSGNYAKRMRHLDTFLIVSVANCLADCFGP